MKIVGLTLSFLLFLNPLAAFATEKPTPKQKTLYKAIVGDVSKVSTALLKSGAGLAFTILGTMAIVGILTGSLNQEHGVKSIDAKFAYTTNHYNGRSTSDEFNFNAWPLICAALGMSGALNFLAAYKCFNSAATDLASINEEPAN